MKDIEKLKQVCEDLDWNLTEYEEDVELAKYTPRGEDFNFAVEKENLIQNIIDYADEFDEEEHAEMWINAKSEGKKGIPPIRDLITDAEDIHEMLRELATALEENASFKSEWDKINETSKYNGEEFKAYYKIKQYYTACDMKDVLDNLLETEQITDEQYKYALNHAFTIIDRYEDMEIDWQPYMEEAILQTIKEEE